MAPYTVYTVCPAGNLGLSFIGPRLVFLAFLEGSVRFVLVVVELFL